MEIVGFCVFLQSQNKVYIKYNRIIVMAKELKDLTKRSENYSQWYNDLVVKADLAEQSPVRGCMVIKPYGYAIWEKMQRILDDMFNAIGAITGYFGGTLDTVLMRFLDILEAIPGLLLTICVSAVLGSGFDKTILALAITSIPQYVRLLRAQVFSVRDEEYLEAAESISCSKFRIITRYVLPNSLSPVIVKATMSVAQTILTAASLSYVGLGVQPPTPEWGAMLSAGRAYIRSYPHLIMFPGIFIMITVLGLNLFGDGLRDALDPKLKK